MIIESLLKVDSGKPSQSDAKLCQQCNSRPRRPLGRVGDTECFGLLCQDCFNSPERKITEERTQVRAQRKLKSQKLRDAISFVVPPLYRDSHIRNVAEIIKKTFLARKPFEGLLLSGSVGCGKTYSLYAFARYLICRQNYVIFYRYEDLLSDIRASYSGNSLSESQILHKLKSVRFLFIDDLGTTASLNTESDFSLRTLFNVLDHRINFMLPTFLSTNKTVEELGKGFDQRILSRIAGACQILNLSGNDKRLQKLKKKY